MKTVFNMVQREPSSLGHTGRYRLALIVLIIYWVGIFIVSHIPKLHVPKDVPVSGALLHAAAYFVLTLLLFANAGLLRRASLRAKKTWLLVGLIGAYAGLDELLQNFVQGRDGSIVDWAVDMASCLFCVGLLWVLGRLWLTGRRAGR